jgi:hypothetical protein
MQQIRIQWKIDHLGVFSDDLKHGFTVRTGDQLFAAMPAFQLNDPLAGGASGPGSDGIPGHKTSLPAGHSIRVQFEYKKSAK